MRLVALVVVVALALAVWLLRERSLPAAAEASATLTYVATAHQLGVVGYRDPAGALSPDGRFVAYAEGRDVRVVPSGGGATVLLPRADGQVRSVTWIDDRRVLADDGGSATRWWVYDLAVAGRAPLWHDGAGEAAPAAGRVNDLRQPVVSLDGAWMAATVMASSRRVQTSDTRISRVG